MITQVLVSSIGRLKSRQEILPFFVQFNLSWNPCSFNREERKWRKWITRLFTHIYQTPAEAMQAFEYFTRQSNFEQHIWKVFNIPDWPFHHVHCWKACEKEVITSFAQWLLYFLWCTGWPYFLKLEIEILPFFCVCKAWIQNPYPFVVSEFHGENFVVIEWHTSERIASKISKIGCYTFWDKGISTNFVTFGWRLAAFFMPRDKSKYFKKKKEWICMNLHQDKAVLYDSGNENPTTTGTCNWNPKDGGYWYVLLKESEDSVIILP